MQTPVRQVQIEVEPLDIRDESTLVEVVRMLNAVIDRVYANVEERFSYGMNSDAGKVNFYKACRHWLAVFATEGGSEGHYIHVDAIEGYETRPDGSTVGTVRHLMMSKTFHGFERAQEIANLVQFLLTHGTGR